jgi:hypothetical protein
MRTLHQLRRWTSRWLKRLALLTAVLGVGVVAALDKIKPALADAAEWLYPVGWLGIAGGLLLGALGLAWGLNERRLAARERIDELTTIERDHLLLRTRLEVSERTRNGETIAAVSTVLRGAEVGELLVHDFRKPWPADYDGALRRMRLRFVEIPAGIDIELEATRADILAAIDRLLEAMDAQEPHPGMGSGWRRARDAAQVARLAHAAQAVTRAVDGFDAFVRALAPA